MPLRRTLAPTAHHSSGVANRAFWLLAEGLTCGGGGKPPAVGIKNACQVFYRANAYYLTRVSGFAFCFI